MRRVDAALRERRKREDVGFVTFEVLPASPPMAEPIKSTASSPIAAYARHGVNDAMRSVSDVSAAAIASPEARSGVNVPVVPEAAPVSRASSMFQRKSPASGTQLDRRRDGEERCPPGAHVVHRVIGRVA